MTDNTTEHPETVEVAGVTYYTIKGLARLVGRNVRTLARWHLRRIGPPRVKVNGTNLIMYKADAVKRCLEGGEQGGQRTESVRRRRGPGRGAPR